MTNAWLLFLLSIVEKTWFVWKVFMLVALVNHSLCWRLVYTSGAPLITSLVSGGTQPQLTRGHNFKYFPSQDLWISNIKDFRFPKSRFRDKYSTSAHPCPQFQCYFPSQALWIFNIILDFPSVALD